VESPASNAEGEKINHIVLVNLKEGKEEKKSIEAFEHHSVEELMSFS